MKSADTCREAPILISARSPAVRNIFRSTPAAPRLTRAIMRFAPPHGLSNHFSKWGHAPLGWRWQRHGNLRHRFIRSTRPGHHAQRLQLHRPDRRGAVHGDHFQHHHRVRHQRRCVHLHRGRDVLDQRRGLHRCSRNGEQRRYGDGASDLSGSFSTMTTATLTIGGVSGAFDVTTLAIDTTPTPSVSPLRPALH